MNIFIIIYLIGVILMGWFWLCYAYWEYKSYHPITLGGIGAAICISLLSWFTILIFIAFVLQCNITITLLKRNKK